MFCLNNMTEVSTLLWTRLYIANWGFWHVYNHQHYDRLCCAFWVQLCWTHQLWFQHRIQNELDASTTFQMPFSGGGGGEMYCVITTFKKRKLFLHKLNSYSVTYFSYKQNIYMCQMYVLMRWSIWLRNKCKQKYSNLTCFASTTWLKWVHLVTTLNQAVYCKSKLRFLTCLQ